MSERGRMSMHLLGDGLLTEEHRPWESARHLEDAPCRRLSTIKAFYVAISRFLNGFITVNAVYALLCGGVMSIS